MTKSDDWIEIKYHNLPEWMKQVSKPKHPINKSYKKIFNGNPCDYKVEYTVVRGELYFKYWRSCHQSPRSPPPTKIFKRSSKCIKNYHYLLTFFVLVGVYFVLFTQFNPSTNPPFSDIISPIVIYANSTIQSGLELSKNTVKEVMKSSTNQEDSEKMIDYVNSIRASNGVYPIRFDSRVYNLAMARVIDMDNYGYMDHTNLQTGTCADSIKTQYGLSNSEYVAENAFGFDTGGHYSVGLEKEAVDSWMTSRGHRYNLLYPHSAGAVACSNGGHCVFLGLNNNRFGQGCYSGADGLAYWKSH